jgi:hypothetical protein
VAQYGQQRSEHALADLQAVVGIRTPGGDVYGVIAHAARGDAGAPHELVAGEVPDLDRDQALAGLSSHSRIVR